MPVVGSEELIRIEKRRHSWSGSSNPADSSDSQSSRNAVYRMEETVCNKGSSESGETLLAGIRKSEVGVPPEIIQMQRFPFSNAKGLRSLKEEAGSGLGDSIGSRSSSGSRVPSDSSDGRFSGSRSLAGDSGYSSASILSTGSTFSTRSIANTSSTGKLGDVAESFSQLDLKTSLNSSGRKRSGSLNSSSAISRDEGHSITFNDISSWKRTLGGTGSGGESQSGSRLESTSTRTSLGGADSIDSVGSAVDVAKSTHSLLPSRDSGICNSLRARNGDFYGRSLQYINPQLQYTHLWDAKAKHYVSNVRPECTFKSPLLIFLLHRYRSLTKGVIWMCCRKRIYDEQSACSLEEALILI